ncbi:hypothetical protein LT85_2983 [Collimonas arenae]|uniref:Uncharacterized protein n=1 Tax=Collimonas arenae TaxID=279058 RepID=A0A0A1FC77_9BURK|nr:hypothetical protein LT85_2983 [Collimonas arenae]
MKYRKQICFHVSTKWAEDAVSENERQVVCKICRWRHTSCRLSLIRIRKGSEFKERTANLGL